MSYSRFLLFFLGSCCLAPVVLTGTSAHAETLSEALVSALDSNPTLDQAISTQKMARQDAGIEKSAYFPTVSVTTGAGRMYGNNATSRGLSVTRGDGYSNVWEGSVSISQMIFDGLKTPHMVAAARERESAASMALKEAKESLALQTILAYLNVMRTHEGLSALSDYEEVLRGYETKIEKMVKEGAADDAELQQARALGIDLRGLLAEFQGQVRSADAEFARLTGHVPDEKMTRPEMVAALLPPSLEEAMDVVSRTHPRIGMLDREIAAAKLTKSAQGSSLYPTVSGELSTYRKDVKDIIGGEVDDDRAMLRLSWSMSTGGAELIKIDKAREEENKVRARKTEFLRTLESMMKVAYSDMATTKEQQTVAKERLSTSQKLLETYRAQFEGGKVRVLQLLQAENKVLMDRLGFLNAEYKLLAAQYSVLGTVGHIQEKLALNSRPDDVR